jgi:hypothetical protein
MTAGAQIPGIARPRARKPADFWKQTGARGPGSAGPAEAGPPALPARPKREV